MQSTKSSKKTRKTADVTAAAAPEASLAAQEVAAKPRASRSSKPKKAEPAETGTVKHHHKTNSPLVAEPAVVEVESNAKTAAPAGKPAAAMPVKHEEIERQAYS